MKKIVIPAKRGAAPAGGAADVSVDKPRERRRLGLNYGGEGGEESRPS